MIRSTWHDHDWLLLHEAPQSPALHMALDDALLDEVSAGRRRSAVSPPWRLRKLSTSTSITASRAMPVWLRRGSTRFCALVVPLSESFSRPMRSTSSILVASMS